MPEQQPALNRVAGTKCDKPVQGDGIMSYHCVLAQGHEQNGPADDPEPCYALESSRSRRQWSTWKGREDARQIEVNGSRFIECPACGLDAMKITDAGGECEHCGARAEHQQDAPDRVLVPRQDARPEVLVANDAAIKAGDIHNPFDAECVNHRANKTLYGDAIEGERCYICRPEDGSPVEEPRAEEDDSDIQRAAMGFTPETERAPEEYAEGVGVPSSVIPTKQREGDQRLPVKGDRVVQDWIIETMEESKRVGTERYGQPLMTFDGRSNIRDLAEELRDGFVYISKLQMMAEADRETLIRVVREALSEELSEIDDILPGRGGYVAEVAVDRILDWVLVQRIGRDQVMPVAEPAEAE